MMAFTPEDIAHVCHAANAALQRITADPAPSPPWEEAPRWQRESAIEGVAAAQDGDSTEELHSEWCGFKAAAGWVYGEVKDFTKMTHPCLVPYSELPAEQRAKDAVFAAIVAVLTTKET